VHFSLKIWHLVSTILMIFWESAEQISCTLNTKGKLAPNWFYLVKANMHQIWFRLLYHRQMSPFIQEEWQSTLSWMWHCDNWHKFVAARGDEWHCIPLPKCWGMHPHPPPLTPLILCNMILDYCVVTKYQNVEQNCFWQIVIGRWNVRKHGNW